MELPDDVSLHISNPHLLLHYPGPQGSPSWLLGAQEKGKQAIFLTAKSGEFVVFNCQLDLPVGVDTPLDLRWSKEDKTIYSLADEKDPWVAERYKDRIQLVSSYARSSINLTSVRESDGGWYSCGASNSNSTPRFRLTVNTPPRFLVTPEDMIRINFGDAIILSCQAEGRPAPEIRWYKDASPVEPSATVGLFNQGSELRISDIWQQDLGDYTCIAGNTGGQISHTSTLTTVRLTAVILVLKDSRCQKECNHFDLEVECLGILFVCALDATNPSYTSERMLTSPLNTVQPSSVKGPPRIVVPPTNQTTLEGEKVRFPCEISPASNLTVEWTHDGTSISALPSLQGRASAQRDGSLVINPVTSEDSGFYSCEIVTGSDSAMAYLNVEYPAKVTFTPTVQYLPFRLAGVVQCSIKANPPLQYVTWTKDKRLLEPYSIKDTFIMSNGSLLLTKVTQEHEGRYTCTPYNAQGTQGSSGPMEVLVRKPPVFTVEPESLYQRKVGETVEMHCDAQEAEGTQKPNIQWQLRNGDAVQGERVTMSKANISISDLRRTDFGYYQCVASNEVATIVSATRLVVDGTLPHAPHNLTANCTETTVTLSWLPGYTYKQDYVILYQESSSMEQTSVPVIPNTTMTTITGLTPGTDYLFQVSAKNTQGDMMTNVGVTMPTPLQPAQEDDFPRPSDDGPKPGPPLGLTITDTSLGYLLKWQTPSEKVDLLQYYSVRYKTDSGWRILNRDDIDPADTSYLAKNLVEGRTYHFRVMAHSATSFEPSNEVKLSIPSSITHDDTAALVGDNSLFIGGILLIGAILFVAAIILSICAIRICNKRRARENGKIYGIHSPNSI
uniref:Uncharacterized protein n=1 Tax=Timema douglasi TaxID=61478 RepID=A0A7R8VNA4_TIMDO|nr:unnamed protein product [Timema douglasi]